MVCVVLCVWFVCGLCVVGVCVCGWCVWLVCMCVVGVCVWLVCVVGVCVCVLVCVVGVCGTVGVCVVCVVCCWRRDLNMFAREELSLRVMEDETVKSGLSQRSPHRLYSYSLTNSLREHLAHASTKVKGYLSRPTPCSCHSLRSSTPLNHVTFPQSC